jgi:SOS-response transcriptional repressor LexA
MQTTEATPLTERQLEIYRWFFDGTMSHGYQPSIREACDRFGISINAICNHLDALAKKGYILRTNTHEGNMPVHSRAIRFLLTPDGRPFAGFVLAGSKNGRR